MADAIILNYVDYDSTIELLKRFQGYKCLEHICIVDNASPNDSYSYLREYANDKIEIIKTEKNGGYGYGNNYGIKHLMNKYNSKHILICNPDIIIEDRVVGELEFFLQQHDDYIIAAPYMVNSDGIKQKNTAFRIDNVLSYIMSFGLFFSKVFKPGEYHLIQKNDDEYLDVDAVAGSLFMIDAKKMMDDYCMYDENIFLYCEERVLGMKCKRAGLKIALLPRCSFVHNHSVSINKAISSDVKKQMIMNRSAMYVIKNYYEANVFELALGSFMMKISVVENCLLGLLKKMRQRF